MFPVGSSLAGSAGADAATAGHAQQLVVDLHAELGAAVHIRPTLRQTIGVIALIRTHHVESPHDFLFGQGGLHRRIAVEAEGEERQIVDDEAAAEAIYLDGVRPVRQASHHGRGPIDLLTTEEEAAGDGAVPQRQPRQGEGEGQASPAIRQPGRGQDLVFEEQLRFHRSFHRACQSGGGRKGEQNEFSAALGGVVAPGREDSEGLGGGVPAEGDQGEGDGGGYQAQQSNQVRQVKWIHVISVPQATIS